MNKFTCRNEVQLVGLIPTLRIDPTWLIEHSSWGFLQRPSQVIRSGIHNGGRNPSLLLAGFTHPDSG
jgi:hypothetical protein